MRGFAPGEVVDYFELPTYLAARGLMAWMAELPGRDDEHQSEGLGRQ